MKKSARYGLIAIGILASFVAGLYLGYRVGDAQSFAEEAVISAKYAVMTDVARTEGTDAAYEDALIAYLGFLESRKGKWSPLFSERVYAMESALTFARLAGLAGKRGASEEATEYLGAAVSLCPSAGLRDCSEESISSIAERLDQMQLLNSGSPE